MRAGRGRAAAERAAAAEAASARPREPPAAAEDGRVSCRQVENNLTVIYVKSVIFEESNGISNIVPSSIATVSGCAADCREIPEGRSVAVAIECGAAEDLAAAVSSTFPTAAPGIGTGPESLLLIKSYPENMS